MNRDIISTVLLYLKEIFDEVEEGEIHGYVHAVRVYNHACRAINEIKDSRNLTGDQIMAIKLAALLHDVDDEKIFGHSDRLVNAERILDHIKFPMKSEVLEMIHLVSFRRNGIRDFYRSDDPFIFKDGLVKGKRGSLHRIEKWKLIPRDSDRLEALGKIGVARCIGFGCLMQRPLFNSSETPRLSNDWSILKKALDYWLCDRTIPDTTIDYFIKGLVLRTIMSSGVKYLENLALVRRQPILDIIKIYGENGYLNREMILEVVDGDDDACRIVKDIEKIIFVP